MSAILEGGQLDFYSLLFTWACPISLCPHLSTSTLCDCITWRGEVNEHFWGLSVSNFWLVHRTSTAKKVIYSQPITRSEVSMPALEWGGLSAKVKGFIFGSSLAKEDCGVDCVFYFPRGSSNRPHHSWCDLVQLISVLALLRCYQTPAPDVCSFTGYLNCLLDPTGPLHFYLS
jgi:hypothetical protein